jgi:hypothetical protein
MTLVDRVVLSGNVTVFLISWFHLLFPSFRRRRRRRRRESRQGELLAGLHMKNHTSLYLPRLYSRCAVAFLTGSALSECAYSQGIVSKLNLCLTCDEFENRQPGSCTRGSIRAANFPLAAPGLSERSGEGR